jgi:hypothetical protein
MEPKIKPTAKYFLIFLLTLVVIGLLWIIPRWQVRGFHGTLDATAISNLKANELIQLQKDLITAENNARLALAQIIGGLVVLLGLRATFKNVQVAQRNVEIAQKNLKVTEDGKITDRFSKAIELLGNGGELNVRLGGIYALERISRDYPDDHWTVIEVLTAFVRERTREGLGKYSSLLYEVEESLGQDESAVNALERFIQQECPTDVQAAMSVISRRKWVEKEERHQRLDLTHSFLNRAQLKGAKLANANFTSAYLDKSSLDKARLNGAKLNGAKLNGANLSSAELNDASMVNSGLWRALLIKVAPHLTVVICTTSQFWI